MKKQKFQYRTCGAILIGGHARHEHCQTHHPGTPFGRLDVYFPMKYKEINGDEPAPVIVRPAKPIKTKTDKHGNVTYVSKKEIEMSLLSYLFINHKYSGIYN